MNYRSALVLSAVVGLSILTACNNGGNTEESVAPSTDSASMETPNRVVKLEPFEASPEFPGASLKIKSIETSPAGKDSVKVDIVYDVANYELKKQTTAAVSGTCNNSKDGQHIHFILDNKPYTALYAPKHSFTVPVNTKHYVMSFLSRSFHESLKNKEAGVLEYFEIDAKGNYKKLETPSTPMVFYSRPKGDYLGDDTKNVLLDYYVYNGTLAADGLKVKASINGNVSVLDKWQPMFIQNAPMGPLKVKLELIDKDGNAVQGDNTTVERDVQLAEREPVR